MRANKNESKFCWKCFWKLCLSAKNHDRQDTLAWIRAVKLTRQISWKKLFTIQWPFVTGASWQIDREKLGIAETARVAGQSDTSLHISLSGIMYVVDSTDVTAPDYMSFISERSASSLFQVPHSKCGWHILRICVCAASIMPARQTDFFQCRALLKWYSSEWSCCCDESTNLSFVTLKNNLILIIRPYYQSYL